MCKNGLQICKVRIDPKYIFNCINHECICNVYLGYKMEVCFFNNILGSCPGGVAKQKNKADRIKSVILASQSRNDNICIDLKAKSDNDPDFVIYSHPNCVDTYVSNEHIQRAAAKKRTNLPESKPPVEKKRRSDINQFDFISNCIFCGKSCDISRYKKTCNKKDKVMLCETIDITRQKDGKTFKQAILDHCDTRLSINENDEQSKAVKFRIQSSFESDLPAVEARYHRVCTVFMLHSTKGYTEKYTTSTDTQYKKIIHTMQSSDKQMWTAVDLHNLYCEYGGILDTEYKHRRLIENVIDYFGEKIIRLSSNGIADIFMFRAHASTILKLADCQDNYYSSMKNTAKIIKQEIDDIDIEENVYQTSIDKNMAHIQCSQSLLELLSCISPKLDNTFTSILVGNMITSFVRGKPTDLQITLGLELQNKSLINKFHKFSVCCSYDHILRFQSSAADSTYENSENSGDFNSEDGLVQIVTDNHDESLASYAGVKEHHSTAVIAVLTPNSSDINNISETIPRLPWKQKHRQRQVNTYRYEGPKKPLMPVAFADINTELSASKKTLQNVNIARAEQLDFEFLKTISSGKCPEYNGFNTRICREQGHAVQPASIVCFKPLIESKPSDLTTMKSVMMESIRLTKACGQTFTILTADQQLYKLIIDNLWNSPEAFPNFYAIMGGFHIVINIISCIGHLMQDTGLSEILKFAFAGVDKMLTGKSYPHNFRALRLLTEVLLEDVVKKVNSYEELMTQLDELATKSNTAKLWVNVMIKGILILMKFIRASKEGDYLLHLKTLHSMRPYIHAAGHPNYSR